MNFIYIKNYLTIPREKKREFIVVLSSSKEFRVTNQKIVLNDNSLILEFDKNSNIEFAKETIMQFLNSFENVSVKRVNKILQDHNEVILTFENDEQKRIQL